MNEYYRDSTGGRAPWDPTRYINIYVINRSYFQGTASSPLSHGLAWDGMAIQATAFNSERVLTHEMGHYFGLHHVFGGTFGLVSCGTDSVSDTPVQDYNSGCPSFPKFSCGNTNTSDMFMNYMDYTNSACKNLFTKGQADRMNASLNTYRPSLLNSNFCSSSVGIESITSERVIQINISPNPFTSQATLTITGNSNNKFDKLEIFDLIGNKVQETLPIKLNQAIINRNGLSAGFYIIKLMDKKGTKANYKMRIN